MSQPMRSFINSRFRQKAILIYFHIHMHQKKFNKYICFRNTISKPRSTVTPTHSSTNYRNKSSTHTNIYIHVYTKPLYSLMLSLIFIYEWKKLHTFKWNLMCHWNDENYILWDIISMCEYKFRSLLLHDFWFLSIARTAVGVTTSNTFR